MYKEKSNFELKDIDSKNGVVVCYPSIFGNIDSDKEMIVPGAFTKTIAERGPGSVSPRIKHLWMHDARQPIAIPTEMKEDQKGLYVVLKFGSDTFSRDKFQQHVDGIITELSIGFETIKSEVCDRESSMNGPIEKYTKLTEIRLWESSSVTWGANSLTKIVSAKGEDKRSIIQFLNDRIDRFQKALRNPNYTAETAELFELEIKQIQSITNEIINELLLKQEPGKPTPEPTDEVTLIRDFRSMLNFLNQ